MIYQNTDLPIYLFSGSPRRRELLENVGLTFTVVKSFGEGSEIKYRSPRYYAETLSEIKLLETLKRHPVQEGLIITADTIVALKKKVIEKPRSKEESIKILKMLEGKWHSVFTAYCIYLPHKGDKIIRSVRSYVKFKPLKLREIINYVNTGESMDKAGAYAIQGMGGFMIEKIEGSFTNVIGLPLSDLIRDLLKLKVIKIR